MKELVVFMASPGDLLEERDRIRRLADDVNALFETKGAGVRVVGWETIQPEYGRPQALINPRVHDCDVFIGILKRRWGSPTGEYSSGFEEEFNIAVERRKTSSKPAISLYFADVPAEDREDPGQNLSKVLAFRERIQLEHIGLYRDFSNPGDLVYQIHGLLTSKLLEMIGDSPGARNDLGSAQEPTRPAATATAAAPDASGSASQGLPTIALDPARQQLSAVLQHLDAIVRQDTDDYVFDHDRVSLMAAAFGRDDDSLGSHLVNRLYSRRRELSLSAGEGRTWTRTLFNDIGTHSMPANRSIPGWGALGNIDPHREGFDNEILKWAVDQDEAVARGATRSLIRLGCRPSALWGNATHTRTDPVAAPVSATNAEATWIEVPAKVWVKLLNALPKLSPAVDYLLHGNAEDRDLLAVIAADESLNDDSREIIEAVLAGLDGDFSLLAAKSPSASDPDGACISELLIRNIHALGADDVNQLARDKYNKPVQLAAIGAGLEKRVLTNQTLLRLLEAEDRGVNDLLVDAASSDPPFAVSLLTVIDKEKLSLVATPDLEPRLMAQCYTADELRASHESNEYSTNAWEALTYVLGDEMVDEAREVLDTNAAFFRDRLGDLANKQALATYVARGACRAAADLLSRSTLRTSEDIVRIAQSVQRSGRVFSLPELLALARVITPETQTLVNETIAAINEYALFRDIRILMDSALAPAIAATFQESDISQLRTEARRWHLEQSDRSEAELRDALYDDDAVVRTAALGVLLTRLNRTQIEELLQGYPRVSERYWYNVVAQLDEHLYANPAT